MHERKDRAEAPAGTLRPTRPIVQSASLVGTRAGCYTGPSAITEPLDDQELEEDMIVHVRRGNGVWEEAETVRPEHDARGSWSVCGRPPRQQKSGDSRGRGYPRARFACRYSQGDLPLRSTSANTCTAAWLSSQPIPSSRMCAAYVLHTLPRSLANPFCLAPDRRRRCVYRTHQASGVVGTCRPGIPI